MFAKGEIFGLHLQFGNRFLEEFASDWPLSFASSRVCASYKTNKKKKKK